MKCYVIATRPYPEKIADDKFYLDRAAAELYCDCLNAAYGVDTFKVFDASIVIDKEGKMGTKKCYHSNIRFKTGSPTCCPDCHQNVWPHEMINIILDSISMYLHLRIGKDKCREEE